MDYFIGIILISMLGKSTCQRTGTDGRNEGIRCFEQIIHDGDITNLLIDVTTPESIDDFCRRYNGLLMCTRENEHFMSVQENTEYLKKTAGVHNFYQNVCPPGTDITAEYKGNSPCFKLIRNEILLCGSDLPDLNSYKMKNNLQSRCCALKNHRSCLKKATYKNCGKEAASVIEKIHARYFNRKIKECNVTSYNCDENNLTTDEEWTVENKGYSSKWNFPTTGERAAEKDWKSTTVADWGRSAEHEEWKKHKHNDGVATVVAHSAIGILSCFVGLLLLKL